MKTHEQEKFEEELKEERRKEQKETKDYSYDDIGKVEKCSDCNAIINSHGHCPNCDY